MYDNSIKVYKTKYRESKTKSALKIAEPMTISNAINEIINKEVNTQEKICRTGMTAMCQVREVGYTITIADGQKTDYNVYEMSLLLHVSRLKLPERGHS